MTNLGDETALRKALHSATFDGRIAPLLAVAAPVALLAVGLAVFSPNLVTQDFWLALVSGREVAQHGLPSVDHLTAMASGHRWVDQQWLGQLFLYEIARLGGIGAAAAVCMFAGAVALWIAGVTALDRGGSPIAILVFLLAAAAAAPPGLQFRTQALALPLFSLTLWLLLRDPVAERNSTLWILPVLCLWANLHGSVVLAAGLVAVYGLQALARRVRGAARARALACVLLSPLTLLASPYASSLPGYYRLMVLNPPFGKEIQEWQQTTPKALTAVFFVLAAAAVGLSLTHLRRLGLLGAIVVAGVWLGTRPATRYPAQFPRALLNDIRAKTASGDERVFADAASADWLLWELPSLRGRVAYDVRYELLSHAQFSRLVDWNGHKPGWQATAKGYPLVVDIPDDADLLVATGRWRDVVSSTRVALVARK